MNLKSFITSKYLHIKISFLNWQSFVGIILRGLSDDKRLPIVNSHFIYRFVWFKVVFHWFSLHTISTEPY